MTPPNPFGQFGVDADARMRCVTLSLPNADVQALLPRGLRLGPQSLTPPGTHPLILLFNEISGLRTTLPSLLPRLDYRELSLGVPYCQHEAYGMGASDDGPYYYQPVLLLDSMLAWLGGMLYWGYPKRMARFSLEDGRYQIFSEGGGRLLSLEYSACGEARPFADCPEFDVLRRVHEQPVISQLPLGMGPCWVYANFDKDWRLGTLRPLHAAVAIEDAFVPGLATGRFPAEGVMPGVDSSLLGAYEMRVPMHLGWPFPAVPRAWSRLGFGGR